MTPVMTYKITNVIEVPDDCDDGVVPRLRARRNPRKGALG